MYILIGNLFLRGLLVKHAKYISLESHLNTLMVSDFGLPVWISIITFCLLNILYLCLNSDFPFNFPNVRTCRGVATFRDNDHQENKAVNEISRNFHNIWRSPYILFTFKNLLRHCSKQVFKHGQSTPHCIETLVHR